MKRYRGRTDNAEDVRRLAPNTDNESGEIMAGKVGRL